MKDFIVIGSRNGLFYKDVFPLVQEGIITLGYTHRNMGEPNLCFTEPNGSIKHLDNSACWITNIPIDFNYIHPLTKTYTPEEYPRYDNYDAINVDSINKIPYDYDGVMGVPIGFLNKHNPKQFEIVGKIQHPIPTINGKNKYIRLLIRRKNEK